MPQKQRAKGVMVHLAVGQLGSLPPHYVPDDTSITKEYYVRNILETHVLPRARAL